MNVVVTNMDNTTTVYNYEPATGRLVALEDFYRDLFNKGTIKGFTITDNMGVLVSHKSI